LLGHVNDAAAAFADLLQEFVAANSVAKMFRGFGARRLLSCGDGWAVHKPSSRFVGAEQSFDALAQGVVARADLLQVGRAPFWRQLDGRVEDGSNRFLGFAHYMVLEYTNEIRAEKVSCGEIIFGPRSS
jgi:hypothetical protein